MDSMEIPYMAKNIIVPADVDLEEISASYHDGFLEVNMPINSEYAGGYRRKIDIDRF
jgi:HSP20 family molecular chaperone IbpA